MTRMIGSAAIVAAIAVTTVVVLSAQAPHNEPATSRELVNEIRALRAVIERFAETQSQTQTIASLMGVQQRRMAEATGRLDTVRRELDAAAIRYADVSRRLAAADQMTPRDMTGPAGTPPLDGRRVLDELRSQLRYEFESVSAQVAQLRARESEILNQVAVEDGRWRELTGRMEQWLNR